MARARLLVVDDSPTALRLVQAALEAAQYEVETAVDGAEALAKVRDARPDLIVTDSVMPGVDGLALLRALRGDPATRAIPIVMLTSGDPDERGSQPDDARPDAIVSKSINMEPLLAEIERALQGS